MKKALFVLVLIGGSITAYGYLAYNTVEFVPEVRTVRVARGTILDTVGATGALEAVTTVNVGSQVSGTIQSLSADFNSIVRANEVIMRLDPSLFETQVEQARANLIRAEADTERLRVALDDARVQLRRAEDLASRQLISETEREAAQVAARSAEAQLRSSEAAVTQAQASLNQNEVNLEHTVIRAPIDGIVISRLVDMGQTVAASLQAPELFIIAADLTKMRVLANIDEADIGRIRPGQRVTFTVDAYPGEEFEGSVSQIRLEPVVTQNVVTYATVIDAPNPDLRLKPGMTATITLEVARRENVLRIPNAALRFRPTTEMFALLNQPAPEAMRGASTSPSGRPSQGPPTTTGGGPTGGAPFEGGFGGGGAPDPERMRQFQERLAGMSPEEREQFMTRRGQRMGGGFEGGGPGRPGGERRRPANTTSSPNIPTVERGATTIDALFGDLPTVETSGQVWIMDGDRLQEVDLRLGVTDGTATEMLGILPAGQATPGALTEDAALVTNITTPDNGPTPPGAGGGSPLMPQFLRGRRR
jgi:HlyD family secretion protein